MTGLANRRHFMALAAAEWSRFQRYYRPLSVLMIDVDHFKSVNDRYGHAVGDDALIAVANACLEGKRSSDIVGRIGGEEFAMLLPETDLYQARIVADRICKAVAASTLRAGEVHFKVTASIGFAAATVSMPGFEALLNAADQALYQAKEQGRNRVVGWSPPPAAKLAARSEARKQRLMTTRSAFAEQFVDAALKLPLLDFALAQPLLQIGNRRGRRFAAEGKADEIIAPPHHLGEEGAAFPCDAKRDLFPWRDRSSEVDVLLNSTLAPLSEMLRTMHSRLAPFSPISATPP